VLLKVFGLLVAWELLDCEFDLRSIRAPLEGLYIKCIVRELNRLATSAIPTWGFPNTESHPNHKREDAELLEAIDRVV
jgi:hypothetical protein